VGRERESGIEMKIQVLGPGCQRCETLYRNVVETCAELGVDAEIEKVTDVNAIAAAGVLMTPGLIVNGKVEASGHLLSVKQLTKILQPGRGEVG
jgi:small redox-active disulfide protein 2